MRIITHFVLIVAITGLASCGGSSKSTPNGSPFTDAPGGNFAVDEGRSSYDAGFPTVIPTDTVQPWEELGANGMVVPGSQRGTSATVAQASFWRVHKRSLSAATQRTGMARGD